MKTNIEILIDILLNHNPTPSARDFVGINVKDNRYWSTGDNPITYHYGECFYGVFWCTEIEIERD